VALLMVPADGMYFLFFFFALFFTHRH
jgi:hypothetical protein